LGPPRYVVDVDEDLTVGTAHGNRPRGLAAQHHPCEDRLAAEVTGFGHRMLRGSERGGMCLRGLPRGELLRLRGAALEALDATTRVDQLLLAGVEGVTLRA